MYPNDFDAHIGDLIAGRHLTMTSEERVIWFERLEKYSAFVFQQAIERALVDQSYISLARVDYHCKAVIRDLLDQTEEPPAPPGMTTAQYMAWIKGWRTAILRGDSRADAQKYAVDQARGQASLTGSAKTPDVQR